MCDVQGAGCVSIARTENSPRSRPMISSTSVLMACMEHAQNTSLVISTRSADMMHTAPCTLVLTNAVPHFCPVAQMGYAIASLQKRRFH